MPLGDRYALTGTDASATISAGGMRITRRAVWQIMGTTGRYGTGNEQLGDDRPDTGQSLRRGGDTLRSLLRSQTTGSALLVVAVAAALVWSNVFPASYETTWAAELSIRLSGHEVTRSLREWVNSGLMTVFFVVVGLEARREFDLGELRERARFVMPLVVGLTAMALPVGIFVALNTHSGATHAWAVAMSTDTAVALGVLGVLGDGIGDRLRVHLVTILVVDDLASVLVIATVYSSSVSWPNLLVAASIFAVMVVLAWSGVNRLLPFTVLTFALWAALFGSGVDPIAAGLLAGLLASAYVPRRDRLENATATFRAFREEPTPELARTATVAVAVTQSMNARLQRICVPWSTFLVVPLFGLCNAGVRIDGTALRGAATSPITWGIVIAMLLGKPLGHLIGTGVVAAVSRGRIRSSVGGGGVLVAGFAAAAPFTLSLLIADVALGGPGRSGDRLAEAKIGILLAALLATVLTAVVGRMIRRLPRARRARLLLGTASGLTDLNDPVDEGDDHIRGAVDSDVTVVEYGDFECPHCGQAEFAARRELAEDRRVRYVWRHLPLTDVHPHAQLAAEAAEAAAAQGAFWEMHDVLLTNQDDLSMRDLVGYARELGLDVDRFTAELTGGLHRDRIDRDVESALRSDVAGTPTFFVNGRRHYGAYDFDSVRDAVGQARDKALATAGRR